MTKNNYAFAEHETIVAMRHSLFRFQSLEQAQLVTNRFATEFTLAPKFSDPLDKKSFVLWIRHYDITEAQEKEGFLGNFGKITIHKLPTGKWTMTLTKMEVPLRHHPLRKVVPKRHPNMGHPILRAAARHKPWPSMQAAAGALMKLHEEYPEVSVPGLNKLKIMTYVKAEKGQSPVQRLELQVFKRDEGVYVIDILSDRRKALPKIRPQEFEGDEAVETQAAPTVAAPEIPKSEETKTEKPKTADTGYYAKLVSKGRKKKK